MYKIGDLLICLADQYYVLDWDCAMESNLVLSYIIFLLAVKAVPKK